MNYTNITLYGLLILGVLLHNLVELNKLNRNLKGNVKITEYLKIEKFSISISLLVGVVAIIVKTEIKQIESAGKWLGLAFVSIGYMGQSLLIFAMGKATKIIDKDEEIKP
ncbi:conserved membrane hypothetical protein [Gammaproteobacteria bacterium]